jgi:peptidase E
MSKRLVLFSQPSPIVFEKLKSALFPKHLINKTLAIIQSDGFDLEAVTKYNPIWQQFAESNGAKFLFIDNSKRGSDSLLETKKLLSSDIVVISGGNTFTLLNHLRLSGLDKAILEFWQKDNVVLAGFSAGAIVLTPTIEVANYGDTNDLKLTNLTGLNIVDFQVWPHYELSQEAEVIEYKTKNQTELRTIGDDDVLVIDK